MNPLAQIAVVLRALHLDPLAVEVEVLPARSRGSQVLFDRFDALTSRGDQDGTLVLESFQTPRRTYGLVEQRGRAAWVLDGRNAVAAIAFDDHAVIVASGQSLLVNLRARASATRALAAQIPRPDLETIFGPRAMARWLSDIVSSSLSDGGGYGRALAVGTFGRLWAPTVADREAAVDEVLRGDSPAQRAWRWGSSLPDQLLILLEAEACNRARNLVPTLGHLASLAGEDRPRWRSAVRRWILARDDLESLLFLLARERAGSDLLAGTENLDEAAEAQLSMFAAADVSQDPRLRAVAWQEPDKWWGQLALPR